MEMEEIKAVDDKQPLTRGDVQEAVKDALDAPDQTNVAPLFTASSEK